MTNNNHKRSRLKSEQILINEVQLLLAEKRTYFSLLRTGIAVFGAPLSVILFLVATAKYHGIFQNPWISTITVGGLIVISLGGLWIFYHSQRKVQRINQLIRKIETENKRVAEIVI